MAEERVSIVVPSPRGNLALEGLLAVPAGPGPVPAVAVAHPHPLRGGDLHNNVVAALCRGAAEAGLATLRFNFRGVGASQGKHDEGRGEQDDVAAAVAFLRAHPGIDPAQVALAGYSFGARVGLLAAARLRPAALLLVAPPLRAPVDQAPGCPVLALVGDRDPVSEPDLEAYCARFPPGAEVRVTPGADHLWWGLEPVVAEAARAFLGQRLGGTL